MTAWVGRYLERLGLRQEAPTLGYLTRLLGAHLATLPFENITKFHYYRRHGETGWFIPPIDLHVENMHRLHAGGTCFTANSSFHQLLAALGYSVYYVACYPPMHMGNVVRLPEGPFYVDVGVGGPLFEPVNLAYGSRQELYGGGIDIRPMVGRPGRYHFDHLAHGEVTRPWELHADEPLTLADFTEAITRANIPGATFMTILRCHLFQPERRRSLSLVNHTLTIRQADGTEEKQRLMTVEALERALAEEFGLPHLPVREAVETLAQLGIDVFAPKE